MRNLISGVVIGLLIAASVAYADPRGPVQWRFTTDAYKVGYIDGLEEGLFRAVLSTHAEVERWSAEVLTCISYKADYELIAIANGAVASPPGPNELINRKGILDALAACGRALGAR